MTDVRINRKLNITLPPFETEKGLVYFYSHPISKQVFDSCYRPMAKALASLVSDGDGAITGPSISVNILREEATNLGLLDRIDGMFLPEIRRLTQVLRPGKEHPQLMFDVALEQKIISEDIAMEAENILVYFTLISWIRLPEVVYQQIGENALRVLWTVQTTSLNTMEYLRSLPTLTKEENTGEKTQMDKKPLSAVA